MKKRNVYLFIIGLLIFLCSLIASSYAYYTITSASMNSSSAFSTSNCLTINLISSSDINLSGDAASPISDDKILNSAPYAYRYEFSVRNVCSSASLVDILLVPSSESTISAQAIKYALINVGSSMPSSANFLTDSVIEYSDFMKTDFLKRGISITTNGYRLLSTSVSSLQNFYLYLWIDENEGGLEKKSTMNKVFEASLVASEVNAGAAAHAIFFNTNGSDDLFSFITVQAGEAVGDLPTPSYSGYSFDGWFTQLEGGVEVDSSYIMGNSNIQLYAHWTSCPTRYRSVCKETVYSSKTVTDNGYQLTCSACPSGYTICNNSSSCYYISSSGYTQCTCKKISGYNYNYTEASFTDDQTCTGVNGVYDSTETSYDCGTTWS